jgi:hypothetical protein
MADEDYQEALGADESEPALEPAERGGGDAGDDFVPVNGDSSSTWQEGTPTERVRRAAIPRDEKTRASMAEAIAKFAADRAGQPGEAAKVAPAAAAPISPASAPAAPQPPAPSLDPEVGRLKQQLASAQAELDKRIAAVEAERQQVGGVADYGAYLESQPRAYRAWLESMRGDKLSEDDFKSEVADFVTLLSSDVLGVRLPDEIRARIDSSLAKKAMGAMRAREDRRAKAETEKQEAARVAREWQDAARALDVEFKDEATGKKYPWLAAVDPQEDGATPGQIVVDVIQSALRKDGTVLSWEEASKQANDYLKNKSSRHYDRRKHLLSAAPVAPTGAVANGKQGSAPGRPQQAPSQVTRDQPPEATPARTEATPRKPKPGSQWDREAHRRETLRAFAGVFKPEE